jgi:hypothetical protein
MDPNDYCDARSSDKRVLGKQCAFMLTILTVRNKLVNITEKRHTINTDLITKGQNVLKSSESFIV